MALVTDPETDREAGTGNMNPKTVELPRSRILIVDDEESLIRLWRLNLEHCFKCKVVGAHSAAEAFAECEQAVPDVVVTNIIMPGMDGVDMFFEVHRRYPTLPVIFCSAMFRKQDQERLKERMPGVFAFLAKPPDMERLIATIAAALRMTGEESTKPPHERPV
jgi:two-component system response regulator GlrR